MGTLYSVNSTTGDITTAGTVTSNTTTSGLLFPRLTTTQRNAIASPTAGMQIYNTTTNMDEFYNGTVWGPISSGGGTPAGSNTQIQYNNSGAFGADPNFTWDGTNFNIASTGATLNMPDQAANISLGPSGEGVLYTTTNTFVVNVAGAKTLALVPSNFGGVKVDVNDSTTTDPSAIFQINGTGLATPQGFLPPRLTTVQRNAIVSPATGLQIYNTDTNALEIWDGSNWDSFGNAINVGKTTTIGSLVFGDNTISGGLFTANSSYLEFNHSVYGEGLLLVDTVPGQVPDQAAGNLFSPGSLNLDANTKFDGTGNYEPSISIGQSGQVGETYPFKNIRISTGDGNGNVGVVQVIDSAASFVNCDPSAILQLDSTAQGFLPPRMTTANRNAIVSPATGLQIYNTDTNAIEVWDGTQWNSFGASLNLGSSNFTWNNSTNTLQMSTSAHISTGYWIVNSYSQMDGDTPDKFELNLYNDVSGHNDTFAINTGGGTLYGVPEILLCTPTQTNGFEVQPTTGQAYLNDDGVTSLLDHNITASAILELHSITRGFLPPRLTTVQRNAIVSPAEGLIVYNTDNNTVDSYNGTSWNSGSGVASAPFTNQGTDISSTPFFTPSATGVYRISIYLVDTTASLGAGAVAANISYKDDSGNTQTLSTSTVALATLGSFTQSDFVIEATSGNAVSYSTSHTGVFGTAKYSVYFVAERIA